MLVLLPPPPWTVNTISPNFCRFIGRNAQAPKSLITCDAPPERALEGEAVAAAVARRAARVGKKAAHRGAGKHTG